MPVREHAGATVLALAIAVGAIIAGYRDVGGGFLTLAIVEAGFLSFYVWRSRRGTDEARSQSV